MTLIHFGFAVVGFCLSYFALRGSENKWNLLASAAYLFFHFTQFASIESGKHDLKEDRLGFMAETGVAVRDGFKIRLTSRAKIMIWANSWIHRIWSLEYLR